MAAAGSGGGNSGSIRAGRAFVELAAKDAGLGAGLAKAKALIAGFGSAIKVAALAGAGGAAALGAGLVGLAKIAGDNATEFDRLSKRVGIPVDQLSAFAYAAGTTGQELGDLEGHFENFAERVYQASQGTGEAAQTFARLGINAAELIRLNPAEQMIAVADAMKGITNDTARRGILSSLGSDQFQGLNDLFKQGGDGIRRLMEQGKAVGAVLDPKETADQAAAMKELNRAWTAGKNAALALGASILPTADNAKKFADLMIYTVDQTKNWIRNSADLASSMLKVDSTIGGIAGHFAELGEAIGSAMSKGDTATAFELIVTEMELLFRTFTSNLAQIWADWIAPFVDTFKDAVAVVKMELADVMSFGQKNSFGNSTQNAIGENFWGALSWTYRQAGFGAAEEETRKKADMFAGLRAIPEDQAAKFRAAIEKNRLAEREEIEMDRARAREEAQAERQQMIAEQNAKLDAIRAKQAENLRKAAAEVEKSPPPKEIGEALQKQIASGISAAARGQFGGFGARQAFGGGQGTAEKILDVAKKQLEADNMQIRALNDLKAMFNKSGILRVS